MTRASRIPEAVSHVRQHWRKGESLKEVAARFGLDPGNLDRAFKRAEGVSVKAYVDARRKEILEDLLRRDHLLGYEIAAELGFRSDVAFYRWVKRKLGSPYSHFRRQHAPKPALTGRD